MSQQAHAEPIAPRGRPASKPESRGRAVRAVLVGIALLYVLVLIVAPLAGIIYYGLRNGVGAITDTFSQPDVRHALYLTVVIMLITVVVTTVLGLVVAFVLARDRFPGKSLLSAFVDLPLAVSPVVVGLMAILLFGRGGWFEPFFSAQGIQIVFALPSIVIVTIFISIPFVIREVVPLLEELGWMRSRQPGFWVPRRCRHSWHRPANIRSGLFYGMALSAARAIGEVGAVLVVSGQVQGRTETATLYILRAFDQYQAERGTSSRSRLPPSRSCF